MEAETARPEFWQDREKAGEVLARLKGLRRRTEPWEKLRADLADLREMMHLAAEENERVPRARAEEHPGRAGNPLL